MHAGSSTDMDEITSNVPCGGSVNLATTTDTNNVDHMSDVFSVSIHGSVLDEHLDRVFARLHALCGRFGLALDVEWTSFGAAAAATSIMLETNLVSSVSRLLVKGERQGGALANRATIRSIRSAQVGGDWSALLTTIGVRPRQYMRFVGVWGAAKAGGFPVRVRVGRWLAKDGRDVGGTGAWLLELETHSAGRNTVVAVDALYAWAARLFPLVQCGTLSSASLVEARQRLMTFRAELDALDRQTGQADAPVKAEPGH